MPHNPSLFMGRRELFRLIGAGSIAAARGRSAAAGLPFASLDHVALTVADSRKSAGFYARIFGSTVYKEKDADIWFLKLFFFYISTPPDPAAFTDHRVVPV